MNGLSHANLRIAGYMLVLGVMFVVWSDWAGRAGAQAQDKGAVSADAASDAEADKKKDADKEGDGERTKNEDDSEEKEKEESLGAIIFIKSGWVGMVFYIVLAIFSIAALAIAMERVLNLTRRKVIPYRFSARLTELTGGNDDTIENFRSLCDSTPSPVARILLAGVRRTGRPLPEVEKAMEDATAREMAVIRGRHRPLTVIASVAPLIGLLGTVVGMILAFRTASQEGMGKAELLAEGIYIALMTTAAGLTIAIPSLLLVAWFNAIVDRFMRDIDDCLLETIPSFTRMENSTGTAGASSEPAASATVVPS